MRERERGGRGGEREVRVDRPNSGQIHKKIKNKQSAQSVMKERRKEEEYKKGSLTAQCIKADTHTLTHTVCAGSMQPERAFSLGNFKFHCLIKLQHSF